MKRCPQCNRLEPDDTLGYCRADGTTLISDSGSVSAESGTVKFSSASVSSEIQTSVLPQTITDAGISPPSAQMAALLTPLLPKNTGKLSKPKPRKAVVATAAVIALALFANAYLYWPPGETPRPTPPLPHHPFHNISTDPHSHILSPSLT